MRISLLLLSSCFLFYCVYSGAVSKAEYELMCVLPEDSCKCEYCNESMTYDDMDKCPRVSRSSSYYVFNYNLQNCGLTKLPSTFSSTIYILDVSYNSITEIPGEIAADLFSLGPNLMISHNPISSVGYNGQSISSLSELDLSFLQLTSVPRVLSGAYVTSLSLGWNSLTSFNGTFFNDIVSLNLERNQLTMHPSFRTRSRIAFLDLSLNSITSIPGELGSLSQLSYYNIVHNAVSSIGLGAFSHLFSSSYYSVKSLDLSYNSLFVIPSDFGDYTYLKYLDLSHNEFSKFPYPVLDCSYLVSLNMSYNKLTSIPTFGTSLDDVTTLDISHNSLTKIPSSILVIPSLTLNVSHNKMQSISLPYVSTYSIPYLIDLSFNNLSKATASSGFEAVYLDLSFNSLTRLPSLTSVSGGVFADNNMINSIGKLYWHLNSLSLNNNKITSIPRYADFPCLTSLGLRNNKLRKVPGHLFSYCSPHYMDLSFNRLTTLPVIKSSSSLRSLNLEYNSLRELSIDHNLDSRIYALRLAYNRLTMLPDLTDFYRADITVDGNCFTCAYAEEKLPTDYGSHWTCNESTMNEGKCYDPFGSVVPKWASALSISVIIGLGSILFFALVFLSYL